MSGTGTKGVEPKVSEACSELYHYTDWHGLEGIWQSGVLWATRYDCLNDTAEVEHLRDMLTLSVEYRLRTALLEKRKSSVKYQLELSKAGGAAKVARETAINIVAALYQTTFDLKLRDHTFAIPHVVSFCTHGQDHEYERKNGLLSQWRAYGGSEKYALVFDTKKLEHRLDEESKQHPYSALHFSDVIYNDESLDFEETFSELIDQIAQPYLEQEGAGIGAVFTPFVRAATRVKHRGFREEREFRIVACPQFQDFLEWITPKTGEKIPENQKPKEAHVRTRHGGEKVHFIKLFDNLKPRKLPITRIIVGPHRGQDALYRKVASLTGGSIRIVRSETPYID